jgi:hypothetical protein
VELPATKPSPESASVVPIIRATRRLAGVVHPVPVTKTKFFNALEAVMGSRFGPSVGMGFCGTLRIHGLGLRNPAVSK